MPRNRPAKPVKAELGQLRIIAGQWRGRKLSFPAAEGLRPTGDRIRETLFNWLQNEISGARCLDLFAGAGSLGLEALSRGAEFCQFIDSNSAACRSLKTHLVTLSCDSGQVDQHDAVAWLQQSAPKLEESARPGGAFDIIFCDPPFGLNLWDQVIKHLDTGTLLTKDAWIYIEAPKTKALLFPHNWQLHRTKDAGQVRIYLFHRKD